MIESLPYGEVKNKIANANAITILSHLNPDADTLGTALGIYALLSQDKSKRVEVVNASTALPLHLDFLPNFTKIKHQMDYTDSLIFSCDCGSLDRLGFDLVGRDIINIDHHRSNTRYGSINIVDADHASASQVAYALFRELYPIKKDAATCFYAALLSDTRYFTTTSMNEEVFNVARDLVQAGAVPNEIAYHFTQRRPLSSLRILEKALSSLSLHNEARIATLMVTKKDIEATGATVPDMEGVVDYGRSLATVEMAVFAMELDDGIRISLRSKKADVSKVAMAFGGGGHKVAAGFTLTQFGLQESIDTILTKIEELGIINEK
ncbi:MAG: DHH family phosphoesterase [Sulfurovum sp.]|jgi:phosphoesterase RecJ-like protein|uniref:DHH family phosphoesterase n=1 Tax=Sulfurovum sp. TaxID=1969726 RepID=UPI003C769AB0